MSPLCYGRAIDLVATTVENTSRVCAANGLLAMYNVAAWSAVSGVCTAVLIVAQRTKV